MKADVVYRFSLCNFSKPDSLYNYGMKPVLYSTIEAEKHYVGWSRVGNNIRYVIEIWLRIVQIMDSIFKSTFWFIDGITFNLYCRYYRNEATCNDDDDKANYTLTFTLTFPHDNDTVYLAHCFPYTYR